ncbi:lipocalin-like domain-containing protein [Flavihumibacter fluvii]|uniref:lipocalin-like domain-containing protein n=1 Tax=Flavihumibacter fluvii TaxID=2838157 RepID=UPI001BDF326B|nr:lipocalin-like domain-containing protein [Flavihumibacter fluvii]ULQ53363.1 lipocalin-like domain-containing protein [Flavihumibacter fluvii]
MKRLYLFLLLVMTVTSSSFGQSKIKTNKPKIATTQLEKLIGTWRLIEFSDLDSATSRWTYRYGKNPKGYFTYTKSGIVNLNISAETPFKISEDSAKNYNINLLSWVDHISVGYFGTYTVDFNKSIVTHHVKGGSLPWYIDTDQRRPFILKGDTLIIGDNKTWKRVLVKEG